MFHKSLYIAYITALLILVVCLLPGSSLPSVHVQWGSFDKLVHFIMYIPLTWALAYGFKYQTKYPKLQQKHLFWSFVLASLYGAFIELLQFAITPDRVAELYDIVADAAGAVLGLLTVSLGERLILIWNRLILKISSIWDVRDY